MTWTTQLTYTAPGLTPTDTAALHGALDAVDLDYDQTTGRMQVTLEVNADTLQEAAADALHTAAAATGLLKPNRLYVLPTADAATEAAHPEPMDLDLIGITEIADELDVSRQRAGQLADDPDFPNPVYNPPSGRRRLYTRTSVRAFKQRWIAARNPRGGPRRAASPDAARA
ncbi:hypothetical protein A5742_17350 [Mycolicibacterium fortuitum]|uniref:DNA-binding protein n=1 Tax=Mycolicibacterium fortuitum TaxID=1766 RepID=A0ABD6QU48_MYCFO|nr:hypothetical protein [Mycolicibacterium fortuitum]OMC51907.1 hypothetical protein A5742_17350 [Mycolicibacterium fortuitum]